MNSMTIHAHALEMSPALREHCERRLETALGRFRERLGRISVWLSDENGPKGGDDLRCRVVADIAGGRTIVVEAQTNDAYASVDVVADKLGVAVAREVDRTSNPR